MATFRRVMKKAASSVIPLANTTTHHRTYTSSAFFSTPLKTSTTFDNTSISNSTTNLSIQVFQRTSIPTHHNFSALAEKRSNTDDSNLLSVIESEIDREEEKFRKVSEVPTEFPFKIVLNAKERDITLTREYQDEEVKVTVEQLDDDNADMENATEEMFGYHSDYLKVCVSNQTGLTLEFRVSAKADGISIERLAVKNPNVSYKVDYSQPIFSDLDENLQKAFYKYLEVRGFEHSTAKFLCDYRVLHREHMKCIMLLQDLKIFLADSTQECLETDGVFTQPEKRYNTDDPILSLIEYENDCAEKKFRKVNKVPAEFPFKIVDNEGARHIRLSREYQGEEIQVTVHEPHNYDSHVSLNVNVSKEDGLTLGFGVKARVADGIITITYLEVRNPYAFDVARNDYYERRSDLWDVDENLKKVLKKTFPKYLEVRGFEPSNTKFLCDYMVQREHKKGTTLLKHLKTFIAD